MAGKDLKTNKQISSMRQILAAIEHFHKQELECAITLAAAGEGQCPESMKDYFFRLMRKAPPGEDHNLISNWLKHPSGPESATITELEGVVMIIRAIQKFVAAYEATRPEFEEFSKWAIANGYTKSPLTEDGRSG
jgi:hypothetical protein